jgi:hypothetical protein
MPVTSTSAGTTTAVNGALADSLVNDFGRAAFNANPAIIPPIDWSICLVALDYGAAASVAVRIFFATAAGAAAENQFELVNTTTQYFVWTSFEIPRDSAGLPYTMRITKAATNANLYYRWRWIPPGGC